MVWAVLWGSGLCSFMGTPVISQRGFLFGEPACVVISGTCGSDMLGWEKGQLIQHGPGLHPTSCMLAPAGEHDGGGTRDSPWEGTRQQLA